MAEGPLPCEYKGLETDAHPPHSTTDEHESGEGGISSSTNGSGGKDNGPHEYVSDNYSSVNSVDLLRLSVNNPSLSTYESQAYRRTDSDSSFFEARNPSQPSKPVQCRRTSKNRSNHVKTRIRPGASGSRHSEDCQHVKNQSQNNTRGDDTTEFTRQRGSDAFPAFDQPDTVHDQASSASGSGALQSFCSGDNPYKYHGSCHKKCKIFMFNAILHCSLLDKEFAHKVKEELENLTLSFLGQNYRPRVALLYSLTRKSPLEAFDEIQSSTMTTNIIILRTKNYRRDKKATATGMKIRDEACGTSVEVTTLDCSPSVKPESRCDAILYRPQSKSFRADMINILSGTRFRDQLLHDEYRRKCEEVTRQQFQRTRWENERRRRSYGSGLSTEDTESNVDRWDIIYSAQNSIQNATNLSESSSTDPKTLPTDSSSSGHKGDVSSTDIESLTPHTQHEGVINVCTTDASITDTSATTSVNETHEFPEFTERELSSASKFNPIFSSVTTFSDSSDGPGYRPQHSKKPTDHSKDRSRGNPNVSNNHESCSSSQELESDCRNEIKKSRNTKECGTESTRRKVATVSPMPKDNDQTVLKILWSACNAETELSLSNQEGVTQQQDTRSHQNSSPYQQTVTTAQSTSPPRHGTSHEARQQTTDVEQNNTDQQHPDINPNRDFPGESSGLQGSTQDLNSQQNLYGSITSFLEGDVGGMTEDRVTNPTDSSDNPREGDGNQQQERRRRSLPPGLFRRFTSLVTCALRRTRRKTLQGKGQKKKPP